MWKNLIRPGAYVVVFFALLVFVAQYQNRFLIAISSPILGDDAFYSYFVAIWVVTTLLYLVPRGSAFYVFIPANAVLLAHSYFVLISRIYFLSFRLDDITLRIAIVLIVGINALMWLKRTSPRDAVLVNLLTLLSSLPLALQWVIVAPYYGELKSWSPQ